VFKGFILSILIAVILNILGFVSVLRLPSFMLAFILGGIFVGYSSYGRIFNGFINGALMGAAGAVILGIISLFTSQISSLTFYIPSSSIQTMIILIVLGSIGGAIGALILKLTRKNRKNRKYDRKIIEDRDRRDDLYWRD
jgi:Family of unknown function (DUF5518)